MEEQALWEIWQDFGVVGTPATDSAGYIRVYAHSTETRSSAPMPLCLGREGRGKVISVLWLGVPALSRSYLRSSYTWGTRVVPFIFTFHLYAWSISLFLLVLMLQLFLRY